MSLLWCCICCWRLWGGRCSGDTQGSAELLLFLEGTQGMSSSKHAGFPTLHRSELSQGADQLIPVPCCVQSCWESAQDSPASSGTGSVCDREHRARCCPQPLALFVWAHKPSWSRQWPPQAWGLVWEKPRNVFSSWKRGETCSANSTWLFLWPEVDFSIPQGGGRWVGCSQCPPRVRSCGLCPHPPSSSMWQKAAAPPPATRVWVGGCVYFFFFPFPKGNLLLCGLKSSLYLQSQHSWL